MTFNGPAILDTGRRRSEGITLERSGGQWRRRQPGQDRRRTAEALAASNTYSGGTTVSGGTLGIDGDWALREQPAAASSSTAARSAWPLPESIPPGASA